jgi:dihydrodipicolinate synthase/N-acetylneuraminate lyase
MEDSDRAFRRRLAEGLVIPAHPLALNARRELDERRQRALTRYYEAAGAGGIAVGVHTTQFAIRSHGMFKPVLEMAAATARECALESGRERLVLVAGLAGDSAQALTDAEIARELGYDCGLLSLGGRAWTGTSDRSILAHCRAVGEVIPLFGFYLQPAVGGRVLSYSFWRELAGIPTLAAVKIAPFNRYQTIDVVRAIVESGRDDVALYTGNDDSIVHDLVTPFVLESGGRKVKRWIAGGLLGQWAVWTRRAVELLQRVQRMRALDVMPSELLSYGARLTDANGAIFDVANGFAGCIAGIHEVLRRQGLLQGPWCLDPREGMSEGQAAELDRVLRNYPELNDDAFIREGIDSWMH